MAAVEIRKWRLSSRSPLRENKSRGDGIALLPFYYWVGWMEGGEVYRSGNGSGGCYCTFQSSVLVRLLGERKAVWIEQKVQLLFHGSCMLWKIRIFFQVHFVNHSVLNFFTFLASFVGVSPSQLPFLLQGRVGDPVASFHSSPFLIAFHFLHDFAAATATSIFPFSSDHEKKKEKSLLWWLFHPSTEKCGI